MKGSFVINQSEGEKSNWKNFYDHRECQNDLIKRK